MARYFILIFVLTLASPVASERIRIPGGVTFFVSPAGSDTNECTSEAAPCKTMQEAYRRARHDYDFAGSGCNIKLADGIHTSGLTMTGTLVGVHLCQVIGNPANLEAVVVQPPPGDAAFNIEDLAMISVSDLTVQGESIIGFHGRQLVVMDIARVKFGSMPNSIAVSVTDQAGANLAGDFWIDGDMTGFVAANSMSRINVANGVSISVQKPVDIRYFAMSYQGSLIEFRRGVKLKDMQLVRGQQFIANWGGIINTNGLVLPGNVAGEVLFGGQVY